MRFCQNIMFIEECNSSSYYFLQSHPRYDLGSKLGRKGISRWFSWSPINTKSKAFSFQLYCNNSPEFSSSSRTRRSFRLNWKSKKLPTEKVRLRNEVMPAAVDNFKRSSYHKILCWTQLENKKLSGFHSKLSSSSIKFRSSINPSCPHTTSHSPDLSGSKWVPGLCERTWSRTLHI